MEAMNKIWFTYIILTSDETLYTGITTDVVRRWREHSSSNGEINKVKTKGAKYFRGRKPTKLVFIKTSQDRSKATKLEISIKKLKRLAKLQLIESDSNQLNDFKEIIKLNE